MFTKDDIDFDEIAKNQRTGKKYRGRYVKRYRGSSLVRNLIMGSIFFLLLIVSMGALILLGM